MSFVVTNIAGSLTAGQVGQQQATAAEQDTAAANSDRMSRELRAQSLRLTEEVAAPEEDTDKRVGQAPEHRERRRRRGARQGQEQSAFTSAPTEDIVDVHEPVTHAEAPAPKAPTVAPSLIDIVI